MHARQWISTPQVQQQHIFRLAAALAILTSVVPLVIVFDTGAVCSGIEVAVRVC